MFVCMYILSQNSRIESAKIHAYIYIYVYSQQKYTSRPRLVNCHARSRGTALQVQGRCKCLSHVNLK